MLPLERLSSAAGAVQVSSGTPATAMFAVGAEAAEEAVVAHLWRSNGAAMVPRHISRFALWAAPEPSIQPCALHARPTHFFCACYAPSRYAHDPY